MKSIEYRVVYASGRVEFVVVGARSVNSGFVKALRRALEPLGNGVVREVRSVECRMVL